MQTQTSIKNAEAQKQALKLKEEGNTYFKKQIILKSHLNIYAINQNMSFHQCIVFQSIQMLQNYITILKSNQFTQLPFRVTKMRKLLQNMMIKIQRDISQWVNLWWHWQITQKINPKYNQQYKNLKNVYLQHKIALTLCPSQGKSQFQERFIHEIYKSKKKLWQINSEEQKIRKKALRSYLINLIQTDISLNQQNKDHLQQKVKSLLNASHDTQKGKIPQALICPISKTLMMYPVCNQYGNSYSKSNYVQHIKKNGKFDPVSKKPLQTPIMYNNINLKKAIQAFLQKNPWAYDQQVQN